MISTNLVENTLRNHEWVQKLPGHHVEMLGKLAEERHFQPDEVLYNQGDIADCFYVIVSGTVEMTFYWRTNTSIAQTILDWEEIGWEALTEERVRRWTAKAMTPVRALVFNGSELLTECEHDPQFGFLLMKQLLRVAWERLDASRLLLLMRS